MRLILNLCLIRKGMCILSVYEQLAELIKSLEEAKDDILGTDNENLDKEQLNLLANKCLELLPVCNNTVREMMSEEDEL